MIKILLYIVIVLVPLLDAKGQDSDKIKWNEGKLHWDDFRGTVDSCVLHDAYACIGFSYKFKLNSKKQVRAKVYSYFMKSKSWRKFESTELLNHEQLHFDIAEVFARKINKEFKQMIIKGVVDKREFLKRYQELSNEHDVMQDLYDNETLHGKDMEKQKEWNFLISHKLNN